MPGKRPGPSVKDPEQYEALRRDGASKEKAARIANASAAEGRSTVGRRGATAEDYEDRTKDELLDRAREIGIDGRSKMSKGELIDALRNH
ncbi:Rho termination factor N-terminal domain-containing protein [Gordonia sp. (in: high G+C Gram-positive bacteria)]|uniref:Rho termination factor N-terminal domain-containing protein n=1 Tax=Gordonia sp. (in: high G+C Gram-positive bacteria) TaxID=84139 RepID=UPI0016A68D09|nr:Rho termination factor N-terminal domain-containing protein [Gordonia sp. (in: high G+C Gram-positive bacteria)]NLG47400.1 Rho termination factor [Gordonia sp. (in: high G+C Gram-positive bacteria)]